MRRKLQEEVYESPEDGTRVTFTTCRGVRDFHRTFFSNLLHLSTLRAVVTRWKRDNCILVLTPQGKDHCRCPVCESLRNEKEGLVAKGLQAKKLKKDASQIWERIKEIDSAFVGHLDNGCLQRQGMYALQQKAKGSSAMGIFHMDAKSQYKWPRFWREVRNVPACRHSAHAIGTFRVQILHGTIPP